jgi:hypothetical protein
MPSDMNFVNFFIDELGSASPKANHSKLYVLSGVMLPSGSRDKLKIKADQIKFKYWGRTDIVFHSREIGRREGDFKNLRDVSVRMNFHKDLLTFLIQGGYSLLAVLVDKTKIPKNWNERTIYKKTADLIVQGFLLTLLAKRNCKGRLVVESATAEKDFYYHKAVGYYLSNGFKGLAVDFRQVQDALTEISFVTKRNNDIEEQIADLLAYGLKLKYETKKIDALGEYEKRLLNVVNQKLFAVNPKTGEKKKKLYSKIRSYRVVS